LSGSIQELFSIPLQDTLAELTLLRDRYPEFFDLFTYKVINAGGITQDHFPGIMGEFLTDSCDHGCKAKG
jgi:hypothetical protein